LNSDGRSFALSLSQVPALEYYNMLLFTIPGTFHIVAGVIKDLLKHLLVGKSQKVKDAITMSIEHTVNARGEPAMCSWVKHDWSKLFVIINSFIHDVPTQLWRFLSDDERTLLMCLWQYVVIIFQEEITEGQLLEADRARICFRLLFEVMYSFESVKPNHVKLLFILMSVRLHGPPIAHSECKIDVRLGDWMARKRKCQDNGSGMASSVARLQMDALVRSTGEGRSLPTPKTECKPHIPSSNTTLALFGPRKTVLLKDALLSRDLLARALCDYGMGIKEATTTANTDELPIEPFRRLVPGHFRTGRSVCDEAHESSTRASLLSAKDGTAVQSAGRVCLISRAGEEVLLRIEQIFVISFGIHGDATFLSGRKLARKPIHDHPFAQHYAWPPTEQIIIALTAAVEVNAVKLQPVTEASGEAATMDKFLFAVIPCSTIPSLPREVLDLEQLVKSLTEGIPTIVGGWNAKRTKATAARTKAAEIAKAKKAEIAKAKAAAKAKPKAASKGKGKGKGGGKGGGGQERKGEGEREGGAHKEKISGGGRTKKQGGAKKARPSSRPR
jgi:hypothetical protein